MQQKSRYCLLSLDKRNIFPWQTKVVVPNTSHDAEYKVYLPTLAIWLHLWEWTLIILSRVNLLKK